jgi:DNA replication and repair protein RecF
MSLVELRLTDLRCLERAELDLHPRLNIISGPNGAGKTSLLEAIYLLGRGRSFRTRHTERLIRHEAINFTVLGLLAEPRQGVIGVGCHRTEGVTIRLNRAPVTSTAQLAEAFPVQVIDPGIHRLVEDGPAWRRRWLDWGVFHVEHGFAGQWSDYSRILKQRNATLKQGMDPTPWDAQLIVEGERISAARERTLMELQPVLAQSLERLLGLPVTVGFFRGWTQDRSLAESLRLHQARDRERGGTGVGPHRFDVLLRVQGRLAQEVLSRGQQKMLGAAMALSLTQLVARRGQPPTLLLDDPAAELDPERTAILLQEVLALDGQRVLTSLDPQALQREQEAAMFHVEQGQVIRL